MKQTNIMSHRAARYESILPTATLARQKVLVVGVGAVGRQVALQLATMGCKNLTLVDFDRVDITNLGTQGYSPNQLGMLKVEATSADCKRGNPDIWVKEHPEPYKSSHSRLADVIFACPDDIDVRRTIYTDIMASNTTMIDTRMSSEIVDVLVSIPPHQAGYHHTLFEAGESIGNRCALNSTIYAATLAASLAVSMYSQVLRGITPDEYTTYNLLANELTVRAFASQAPVLI